MVVQTGITRTHMWGPTCQFHLPPLSPELPQTSLPSSRGDAPRGGDGRARGAGGLRGRPREAQAWGGARGHGPGEARAMRSAVRWRPAGAPGGAGDRRWAAQTVGSGGANRVHTHDGSLQREPRGAGAPRGSVTRVAAVHRCEAPVAGAQPHAWRLREPRRRRPPRCVGSVPRGVAGRLLQAWRTRGAWRRAGPSVVSFLPHAQPRALHP